jgi:prepilin-type N-terminal cleavage/methylation domain-containing protein
MRRMNEVLTGPRDESGMSLVEVIVAMFVFAIVSSGVIYGMLSVITLSRDSRAREIATNLAAQEIDTALDAPDLFDLLDKDRTESLANGTFYVQRRTQWVTDPTKDIVCGAGGGSLRYKRVNVTVSWENMRGSTKPVRADTIVHPAAKINDPTKGTILVSVLGPGGAGVGGVAVGAVPSTPKNGAVPLTDTPASTDAQGCSYVLKAVPGNYDVTVSRSGYVDAAQSATSTKTVTVTAGSATAVSFQYAAEGTFNLTYAGDYVGPAETVRVPAVPTTTFVSTYGAYVTDPASSSGRTRTMKLHPFAGGYEIFAGSCKAADPLSWPAGTDATGKAIVGQRPEGSAAVPGGNVNVNVPMGVVKLALGPQAGGTKRYLRAVSAVSPVPASGDPGCASTVEYSFGSAGGFEIPSNGNVTVALPYGSWRLFHGTTAGSSTWTTAVPAAAMSGPTNPVPGRTLIDSSGIVTFDPRVVAP